MSDGAFGALDESAAFARWRPRAIESAGAIGSKTLRTANARERWRAAVRDQLAPLTTLKDNWDTYGAGPVKTQTIIFAAQMLDDIWINGLPVPSVMPTSGQSVYFEWNTRFFDFSIEVKAPYDGLYYFDGNDGKSVREGEFRDNFGELERLTRQAVNQLAPSVTA